MQNDSFFESNRFKIYFPSLETTLTPMHKTTMACVHFKKNCLATTLSPNTIITKNAINHKAHKARFVAIGM